MMPHEETSLVYNGVKNTVTLTQKGLLDELFDANGMTDCNPNSTYASASALGVDPYGEPMPNPLSLECIAIFQQIPALTSGLLSVKLLNSSSIHKKAIIRLTKGPLSNPQATCLCINC